MARGKIPRKAWDSNAFIAWANRSPTEDPAILQALDETMTDVVHGRIRLVASQVIETEVRFLDLEKSRRFHQQLRACPYFESFGEGPAIRRLARELQDRLEKSKRRGGYADLLHVATAIAAGAEELWTTDKRMVRWFSEGVITEVVLRIPYLEQGVLNFGEEEEPPNRGGA